MEKDLSPKDGNNSEKERVNELDAFWDIDALLPKKKQVFRTFSDTEAVEVVSEVPEQSANEVTDGKIYHRFIPPHTATEGKEKPAPISVYQPINSFIKKVTVYPWKNSYPYYDAFSRTAQKIQDYRGKPCDPVPFFSYSPQYEQMTPAQKNWYLYWRDQIRNGEYPAVDSSYILLLSYEIINLPVPVDPAGNLEILLNLWLHYRGKYPQLNTYLPDWICDYGLIHQLPPPKGCFGEDLIDLMNHCHLKEYFIRDTAENDYGKLLLAFCNGYQYRKSKFYQGNEALYEKVMPAVLTKVINELDSRENVPEACFTDSFLTRDSFIGSICCCRCRRRIEIFYRSVSRSHELRFLISDILRYAENQIRSALGVRSKLSVEGIRNVRPLIDKALVGMLPERLAVPIVKKQEEPAEYEKLYDLPKEPFSLQRAENIEFDSWETAKKLTDAFSEDEDFRDPPDFQDRNSDAIPEDIPDAVSDTVPDELEKSEPFCEKEEDGMQKMIPYAEFLQASVQKDTIGMRKIADGMRKMLDAVAEEINELAIELLGDILLEDNGDGYEVIADYQDDLLSWLKGVTNG